MALFWALVGSKWVRRLGLAVLVVSAYAMWEAKIEKKGADRVIVKLNIEAEKISEKAEKARARAGRAADPVAELRSRTCPGCQ